MSNPPTAQASVRFLDATLKPITWAGGFYAIAFSLFVGLAVAGALHLAGADWREVRTFFPALAVGALSNEAGITIRSPKALAVICLAGALLVLVIGALM